MGETCAIRVFVPDGDPEGAWIVELLNSPGIGIDFPRADWPQVRLLLQEVFLKDGL
jgi:hypothetical protein